MTLLASTQLTVARQRIRRSSLTQRLVAQTVSGGSPVPKLARRPGAIPVAALSGVLGDRAGQGPGGPDEPEGYGHAAAYREHHGHLDVTSGHVTDSGHRLGQWILNARQHRRKGWMPADRITALDRIGMIWTLWESDGACLRPDPGNRRNAAPEVTECAERVPPP
ncbi:helicase associated domain-containing protein [Streptomyces sp. NPDC006365]|uniref:helicase associated domain-containing protein n=1 Tax=Streptomyces sp. NPDC006365 TaxID=3364744 RepID=UPI00367C1A00